MNIEKRYIKLEDTTEIRIENITEKELFNYVEPEYKPPEIPFIKILKNLPCDVNVFIPYDEGKDFIIHMLGISALERGNIKNEDIEGRLLSKCSPVYSEILQDTLYEVYKTHKTKKLRILYYLDDKLARLANVKIVSDMEKIILISDIK